MVIGDLTLIRPLGWTGVPIVAVSADPRDPSFRSRHVQERVVVPGFGRAAQDHTAVALERLGRRLRAAAGARAPLFYGSDSHLDLMYRHRERLEHWFQFLVNPEPLAWALLDKHGFASACRGAGVEVPATVTPGVDGDDALDRLRGPLLVKPRTKVAWKPIREALFDGRGKARAFPSARLLRHHPGFAAVRELIVVQELLDLETGGLVSFHGFADEDGRLLAWFCGRKIRTYPRVAGESALVEMVEDTEVEAAGSDVARRLGVRGPFKIDLARDRRSGHLVTLEVNARFTLWNHLGAAAGVNLPRVAYDWLVHRRAPSAPPAITPGVRWSSLGRDVRGVRDDPGGPLVAWARWARSMVKPGAATVHEVFDWRDPMPALVLARQLAGGALSNLLR